MITAEYFNKNTLVLVVGAGRSGLAALHLAKRCGCQLAISDGGQEEALSVAERTWLHDNEIFCEFGGHRRETFVLAEVIIVSPGVPLDLPELQVALQQGIPILGEMEFASLFTSLPIIAVTGTNGKTTVTTLIAAILEKANYQVFIGGNIGIPLSEFILAGEEVDVLVLEVSSFQLDTAPSFHAKVALLLNISPDHLDRYPDFGGYADAKMAIFRNQGTGDAAIINGEDVEIAQRRSMIKAQVHSFSTPEHGQEQGDLRVMFAEQEELYPLPTTLQHSPNRQNCHAAILAVRSFGCTAEALKLGLAHFAPLEHRITEVAQLGGVRYVDDSKATNIGAVISALGGQQGPVLLIAGGRDKGGDYRLLLPQVERIVKKIIVLGEAAGLIRNALESVVDIEEVDSLDSAVKLAAECGLPGDTVLLSPACASFDMFSSYQERGRVFQQAIQALGYKAGGEIKVSEAIGEAA